MQGSSQKSIASPDVHSIPHQKSEIQNTIIMEIFLVFFLYILGPSMDDQGSALINKLHVCLDPGARWYACGFQSFPLRVANICDFKNADWRRQKTSFFVEASELIKAILFEQWKVEIFLVRFFSLVEMEASAKTMLTYSFREDIVIEVVQVKVHPLQQY